MNKKDYIIIISILVIICIIAILIIYILSNQNENDNKNNIKTAEIAQIEETDLTGLQLSDDELEEEYNQQEEISIPYYKSNTSPATKIDGFHKVTKMQSKVGGGTTSKLVPDDWNEMGSYISKSKSKIYDEFIQMELNSDITDEEFINKALDTIRNNSQSWWACNEKDSDVEYNIEEIEINGYSYNIINGVATSKYTPHAKTYIYIFPLQKNNILYFLMAEIGEEDYTNETIDTVEKVFSSYYIQ